QEGNSILHYAVQIGNLNILNAILAHDPDITLENNFRENAIHIAVSMNRKDLVKAILSQTSPGLLHRVLNSTSEIKQAPLHLDILNKNFKLVKYLLEIGANPNIVDANGDTPESLAIKHRDWDSLKLISEHPHFKRNDLMFHNIAIAHKLGISDFMPTDHIATDVRQEGMNQYYTFPLLAADLKSFINSISNSDVDNISSQIIKDIEEAFSASAKIHSTYIPMSVDEKSKAYKDLYSDNKICILPVGSEEHGIGVAFYKNKLLIANRGAYRNKDYGIQIYEIKNDIVIESII